MTTGALIFAFNNEHIDYLAMARWAAKNIQQHLDIPTAIVTDQLFSSTDYEQCVYATPEGKHSRKFEDIAKSVTWFNGNRVDAYNLSPWDRTLVLDADYVVVSDQLKTILDIDQDFIAHKTAYDVTGKANFDELNNFGTHQMPMWWATVMMFRRSNHARLIFECMHMIKTNWDHYRNLYGVMQTTYRNDFALSIALGIVNGHTLDHPGIPWNLATVTHDHKLTKVSTGAFRVDYVTTDQKPRWIELNQDFHAMGKGQLGAIIASTC